MAKNNQRDPSLRLKTVARVNQLVKTGLSKAGAFEKISAETGRAKDAVQMLYYRAMRAAKSTKSAAPKAAAKPAPARRRRTPARPAARAAAPVAAAKPVAAPPAPRPSRRRRRSRSASRSTAPRVSSVAQSGDFPMLLNGIAAAINALLKHVEKTVEENKTLKGQAQRLKAIANLIRGR